MRLSHKRNIVSRSLTKTGKSN